MYVHSRAGSDFLELFFLFHFPFVARPLLLGALALLQLRQREIAKNITDFELKPVADAPAAKHCQQPRILISAAGQIVADKTRG